jgi:hypothetical protein
MFNFLLRTEAQFKTIQSMATPCKVYAVKKLNSKAVPLTC